MTEPTYVHIYDPYGDEVWVKYEGPCGQQKPVSVTRITETGYSVVGKGMKLDLNDAWTEQKIRLATIPVDWRDEAWSFFKSEENGLYSKGAIDDAYEMIEHERRTREADEILDRVSAWGEDKYAAGTVFRFNKEFTEAHVTGSYGAGRGFPAKVYTYAVLKLDNNTWKSTGRSQFSDWDAFVKFLVTEGNPVTKADVEIFPPAVFQAEAGTEVKTEITGIVQ